MFFRCRLRISNPFLAVGMENRFFIYFFYRKRQWGTRAVPGVIGEGETSARHQLIPQKNRSKKFKNRQNRRKIGKFFLLELVYIYLDMPLNLCETQKSR